MKKIFLFMAIAFGFASKGLAQKNSSATYIAPKGSTKSKFEVSSGAFFFDATKRMGFSNVVKQADGTYVFKFLGEEQPDAIYETLKDFFSKAGANLTGTGQFNVELGNSVEKLVDKLTVKSNALNFLRTGLYRINEAAFNGDIDKDIYQELCKLIICETVKIQLQELNNDEKQVSKQ